MDASQSIDLARANRILARHGVVDAFGHVSVRDATDPSRFLLSRNMAPRQVRESDILVFGPDGEPVAPDGSKVYLERYIHSEIYRARPDVQAVVHSHSDAVIPFGAAREAALRPLWHMCGFLHEAAPVFEIRDHGGPETNMLIVDPPLGAALAGVLGAGPVVLMRGHGATVVGASLREAVFRAIYTQRNASIQLAASALGPLTFLNPQEAANAEAANAGQVDRAWDLWCADIDAGELVDQPKETPR